MALRTNVRLLRNKTEVKVSNRRIGRPPRYGEKMRKFYVSLPEAVLHATQEIAVKEDISIQEVVRGLITDGARTRLAESQTR